MTILIHAQVNIEQYRDATQDGALNDYRSSLGISTSFQRSTVSQFAISLDVMTPFQLSDQVLGFFISNINYGKNSQQEYLNDSFFHFRLMQDPGEVPSNVRRIDPSNQNNQESFAYGCRPEMFAQYQQNRFEATAERYLVGAGVRYMIGRGIILGSGVLNEWFRESTDLVRSSVWRVSQYIQMAGNFNDANRWTMIVYIQPKLLDVTNRRLFGEAALISQLTHQWSYQAVLTAKQYTHSQRYRDVELFFKSGIKMALN